MGFGQNSFICHIYNLLILSGFHASFTKSHQWLPAASRVAADSQPITGQARFGGRLELIYVPPIDQQIAAGFSCHWAGAFFL